MCGIVAVVRRRAPAGAVDNPAPDLAALGAVRSTKPKRCCVASSTIPMLRASRRSRGGSSRWSDRCAALPAPRCFSAIRSGSPRSNIKPRRSIGLVNELDVALDTDGALTREIESLNAAVVSVKDACWALSRDRLRTARSVEQLGASSLGAGSIATFHSIQIALAALDRLEVRGRDSAGLHVLVAGHGIDLADPTVARLIADRNQDPLFTSGSVRVAGEQLAFVYKVAAEIGELGDNVARLRAQIAADEFLRLAVRADTAEAVVLAHTRWASVGIISEANAHPLNQEELDRDGGAYVVAALNGDVDNYADLKALEALHFPAEITTDAKVIPALVSRRIAAGSDTVEAFRSTVAAFEGSVAIAAQVAAEPGRLLLAQRGSGQALYVGVAEEAFVIASEPYGVVEECDRSLRLDGETMLVPGEPATQGQIVSVSAARGVERWSYDGSTLPVDETEMKRPEITTRDVDRGEAPHFLLKEIYEAPGSFHKTLRGRIVEVDGSLEVRLGPETMPASVVERLCAGAFSRIIVTGQGTAAIAGQGVALALRRYLAGRPMTVDAVAATELSGFGLATDMTDVLVITISQSGTTADTNRTVDLVRARGASVIGIVNRRQSDLVEKCDGVLYTSDGRDLEMSVASTKAFYAQIAAGFLLAFAIASELGEGTQPERDRAARHEILAALRNLPEAMRDVLDRRPSIALAAQRHALSRRSWAVVGNGVNRVAAEEIRIKLSELCYKSISCDIIEDKKHIDLSAEPMIVVCAAGLHGSNADDVSKEIAIYRAHKSAPIVIADEGEGAVPRGTRDAHRSGRTPRCFVRSVHDGRAPLRLRSSACHRCERCDRCARHTAASSPCSVLLTKATSSCARCRSICSRMRRATSTVSGRRRTTERSTPARRCGSGRCCVTPPASSRSTCTRSSSARSGRRARWSRT